MTDTEIVIVGAGPAGCLLAAILAQGGRAVTVLDSGPEWKLSDLISSQIWARRLKWSGAAVEKSGALPGHNFQCGSGFGGAALHHYGGWPRLHPADFRMRTLTGEGRDWPIAYDDLQSSYDRIQAEVGIAGDVAAEPWRPDRTPYPMPPLRATPQAEILARGFAALDRAVAPTPAAINSVPFGGRPACLYDGWCDAGCPIGALANPLVTYLPRARAAGAHFRGHSTVTRVLFEKRRASGVEYVTHSGAVRTIAGQVVILAASAVQNPGILFHSRTSLFPQGPGNTGGALGRYFHTHLVLGAYGLFDDETENHRGVSLPILSEQEPAHPQAAGVAGAYRWGLAPALKPNDLLGIAATRPDLHGAALADFMRRSSRHLAVLSGLCATRVLEENRVELTAAPDHAGRARVRIHYRVDTATRELHARALQDGIRLLRAAGAREAWTGPAVTAHLLGGTIMGADPRDSVCDSYGRIHDVPNLFVAGGGLFPTCGSAAPTFTLHALALRSGEWILGNWSALAD